MSDPTDDKTLEQWVGQLMDDDEDRLYAAASALWRLGHPALGRALELAHDPRPRMREMACCVLGQVRDEPPPGGAPRPEPPRAASPRPPARAARDGRLGAGASSR